jgi:hypothetical protein
MGSYTTSGGNLMTSAVQAPYCVTGNTLVLPVQIGNFVTAGTFEKQ